MRLGVVAMLMALAGACSPGRPGNQAAGAAMDHLQCAAMISAADKLITSGAAPADPAFSKAALVAAMTHLNAWAIPRGMEEPEAFASIAKERDRILAETDHATILANAKTCVEEVPGR